jgi:hypothetical protein
MACGADNEANDLIDTLTNDVNFDIPNIDITGTDFNFPLTRFDAMYNKIEKLKLEDLTTKEFNGTGAYDVIAAGMAAQLANEFKANRIPASEYTKAFIASQSAAITNAVQFLLQKETAFWQAQTAQVQALTARVQFEAAKMAMVQQQYDALTAKANYAKTKMELSNLSMQYCTAKYQLEYMFPMQLQQLTAQRDLTKEQIESQRAQTLTTRVDGTPITGLMGKQRDLYDQQITSYKRDAEVKTAKLFTDAWVTMKTIDEGITAPNGFTNTSIDQILTTLKFNNGLNA